MRSRHRLGLMGLGLFLGLAPVHAELPLLQSRPRLPTNQPPRTLQIPSPARNGSDPVSVVISTHPPGPVRAVADWPLAPAEPARSGRIGLGNGDQLPGRLVALGERELSWESPATLGPSQFQRAAVDWLEWPEPALPAPDPVPWAVRLRNGDLLVATNLLGAGPFLDLATDWAGELSVPRSRIASLQRASHWPLAGWPSVQTGSDPLPEPLVQGRRWLFRDNLLPESALVTFDLAAAGLERFWMGLYLRAPGSVAGESYLALVGGPGQLGFREAGAAKDAAQPRPVRLSASTNSSWRVVVAIQRTANEAVLYLDGERVQQIKLTAPVQADARGLAVVGDLAPGVRLGGLQISPGTELPARDAAPNQDTVRLINGDLLRGKLLELGAESLTFTGALGRVELSLERVVGLELARDGQDSSPVADESVLLELHGGSRLRGFLGAMTTSNLIVRSSLVGPLRLARQQLRSLRFIKSRQLPPPPPMDPDLTAELVPNRLWLRSGQTLEGQLHGIEPGLLHWQHPAAVAPLKLRLDQVRSATTGNAANPRLLPQRPGRVLLANGDQLHGELVPAPAGHLGWRTDSVGLLRIPFARLARLEPSLAPTNVLAHGPSDSWVPAPVSHKAGEPGPELPRACWVWRRDDPLPDRVCLQFDVIHGPAPFSIATWLFSDPSNTLPYYGLAGGSLVLSQGSLFLQSAAGLPQPVPLPDTASPNRLRVTWLADRARREMFALVDGRLLAQLREVPPPFGNRLQFFVFKNPQLTVTNIVLAEWRGPVAALTAPRPDGDLIRRHDWTSRHGVIGRLDSRLIELEAATEPMAGISVVEFAARPQPATASAPPVLRVLMWDGDRVSLTEPRLDQERLRGSLAGVGEISLPRRLIRRLEWGPTPAVASGR